MPKQVSIGHITIKILNPHTFEYWNTENTDNTENTENTNNSENTENKENTENTENTNNTENPENTVIFKNLTIGKIKSFFALLEKNVTLEICAKFWYT